MAIGTIRGAVPFQIYDEQVHGGFIETLTQQSQIFNASSANTIRLLDQDLMGEFANESFLASIPNLVVARDPTSVAPVADKELSRPEISSVKLNRRIGPIANTLDSFKKIAQASGEEQLSFLIGTQIAKAVQVDQVNVAINALDAAITAGGASTTFAAGVPMDTQTLNSGNALMGDAAQEIIAYVAHSTVWHQLIGSQITSLASAFHVAGVVVQGGIPASLGRPIIVTDSPALVVGPAATPTDFITLGLTLNACEVTDSEPPTMHTNIVDGLENLVARLQGETAFNVGVKGYSYDKATAGPAPDDATLGTAANWLSRMSAPDAHKLGPGVRITTTP